jgi:hypothetical protein
VFLTASRIRPILHARILLPSQLETDGLHVRQRNPRGKSPWRSLWVTGVLLGIALTVASGAEQAAKAHRRAQPPQRNTLPSLFFEDAFRDALVGDRPRHLGRGNRAASPNPTTVTPADQVHTWSNVIARESLEGEVKAIHIELAAQGLTPGKFREGGNEMVGRSFSLLATLFAVIAEYDGEVRWKAEAPRARDLFARAAANSQVSSPQAFHEAQQRLSDLRQLVLGGWPAADGASRTADWAAVGDRALLMHRLRISDEERLPASMVSVPEFRRRRDVLLHEAQIVGLIAEVLTRDGMPDAEEADYANLSRQLRRSALDMAGAVNREDHGAARRATAAVNQSCNDCHERYRG